MIVADTSGLLAYFNGDEPAHAAVAEALDADLDAPVVSPFVLAELDYLVATRVGVDAERAVLAELTCGAYDLAAMDVTALRAAAEVVGRYRHLGIGLADASLVVLAQSRGTTTLLTLDRQHFLAVRPLTGGHFTLLP